jgi:UDP-galactose transporter B1
MVVRSEVRFLVYVAGIYISLIYWGYLQEKLTSKKYNNLEWNYPFALNFLMASTALVFARIGEYIVGFGKFETNQPRVSAMEFWKASLCNALASPIGYEALKYISFPMVILTKSSKPVPVMLMGLLWFKKKYTWYKYVSVLLLCGGIGLFLGMKESKNNNQGGNTEGWNIFIGIALVLTNLSLDSFVNNDQDRIFAEFKITSLQMMKFINMWQSLLILGFLLVMRLIYGDKSELQLALNVFQRSPEVQYDLLLFCMCAATAQVLIFAVMQEFGSLVWITISISRKLLTILFSVFMFNHSVNIYQWIGIVTFFTGLILEISMSYMSKQDDQKKELGNRKKYDDLPTKETVIDINDDVKSANSNAGKKNRSANKQKKFN